MFDWAGLSRVGFSWTLLNIPNIITGAVTLVSKYSQY